MTKTTPEVSRFEAIAQRALKQYDIPEGEISFIGQSDGVLLRVYKTCNGKEYSLRIHNGVGGYRPEEYNQLPAIESGLQWLEALGKDTDLILQQPLRNRDGEMVSTVHDHDEKEKFLCSVVTWIEGESLEQHTIETVHQVGGIAARLHAHATAWNRSTGFRRPQYKAKEFRETFQALEAPAAQSHLVPQESEVLARAGETVCNVVAGLSDNADTWGPIHGDLGWPGNIVVQGREFFLIDFNGCSLGHYACDIAWAFCYIPDDLRQAFIVSYDQERPGNRIDIKLVEVFVVGVWAILYQRWMKNAPQRLSWLPQFVQGQCQKLLAGEPFLFG